MLLGLHHSGNCAQRLVFTLGTGSPHLPPHLLLRWKISRKLFLVSNDFESASTPATVYILFLTVLAGEASSELERSINWYALEVALEMGCSFDKKVLGGRWCLERRDAGSTS
jgi:hypothetical protein